MKLFKGRDDLILGFTVFLPAGYKLPVDVACLENKFENIQLNSPNDSNHDGETYGLALEYLDKVKSEVSLEVYDRFLDTMKSFKEQK